MGKVFFPLLLLLSLGACSFNYGENESDTEGQPDIVMRQVEYVRVRDGDPEVRFRAELAERYEKRQVMELRNFSFEQFNSNRDETGALGRAGTASVELDTRNIHLANGVRLEIESEDITIETAGLDWQDKERRLTGGESAEVNIFRTDGTTFTGWGFSANARSRTWEFSAGAEGTYIHEDEEDPVEPEEGLEAGDGEDETLEGAVGEEGRDFL